MRPALYRVLGSLVLIHPFIPSSAAEAVPPAKVAPVATNTPMDQFIANARKAAATGSTELKEVVAQLDPLKVKQRTLLATQRAKETELARLQAANGDPKRIATLRTEIGATRSQLNIVDTQFQVLAYRIQALQNPGNAANAMPHPNSLQPMAAPTPAQLTRTVPPDKIKAAADSLEQSPNPTAAAARAAATQILAANRPGYTSSDLDHLAQLVLQLAAQDNSAALKAELKAIQAANDPKAATSDPAPIKLVLPSDPKPTKADSRKRIQELQARQTKLEQALIEVAMRTPAPSPADKTAKIQK